MIRILVTAALSPQAIDRLNEIPEFEISERTGLAGAALREEIRGADALVAGDALTAEVLEAGSGLKLVICCGAAAALDEATARSRNVEVRRVAGGRRGEAGAIAVLKDFFNV